ncbi:MAG: 6-phospho-alpha-glucosidase [Caldibacillus debilis]|mgnify:CR=1 FL=1|uniref:6-phospho-alpha-glucosidase n=1 Tax=Caldibacillus debilis TaxID=301148 RepID=A0A3E0K862_9BACI|nr:6-phospho-alpha-glucosidase [Caldibacillus debilis]MBY6271092.1 6-phospho-alpha-glucosidase [Bacillaceae bacterium]OUM91932.1 MAG: 6-phospho-alpha-glucosidase [Caldibacillus debilis]REJ18941.1 MAG: 6-phospho-alpha-glucosidase [Caldibacillus debilis]REJ30474.1 MAG: 6-phospho-alpha-glucosidase [Caldibacillus debilis]REJ30727.1 MAG: 6-phospho-alpha-glucosidase [Caldibacillus debilis]
MKKQRLVIAGSGSTYTIGMVMSLIAEKENFPLESLVFYDIDEKRQALNAKATEILLKEYYPELRSFTYTTDKKEAFKNADFVFVQIRTGGLKMREKDEQIPLKYGVVGQETCGPGGMAYGLRSIKDMIELIYDIRKQSPDAWILNYTNPAAIVAEALKREFPDDRKILNICDMPIAIMVSYAKILGLEVWDLVPEYFGLNHFGWFTKIYDKSGNDLTERLKNLIIEKGFKPEDAEIANDPSWIKTFEQARKTLMDFPEYLPNTYLQYYLYPEEMVKKEDPNHTRARQVMEGREKRVRELCGRIIEKGTAAGEDLHADIHGVYMIRAAESLAYNLHQYFIVMVENRGVIPNLPQDAMVEVTCVLTSDGPKPFAVGEIPTFYKGLIEGQFAYEKLVVDAYYEKSYLKLLQALTLNRTVVDTDKARRILDELIEANKGYWPDLK